LATHRGKGVGHTISLSGTIYFHKEKAMACIHACREAGETKGKDPFLQKTEIKKLKNPQKRLTVVMARVQEARRNVRTEPDGWTDDRN